MNLFKLKNTQSNHNHNRMNLFQKRPEVGNEKWIFWPKVMLTNSIFSVLWLMISDNFIQNKKKIRV